MVRWTKLLKGVYFKLENGYDVKRFGIGGGGEKYLKSGGRDGLSLPRSASFKIMALHALNSDIKAFRLCPSNPLSLVSAESLALQRQKTRAETQHTIV